MTHRGVHKVYITAATLLAVFMALWCYAQYREAGEAGFLASAAVSLVAAVGLVGYGVWFLGKTRRVR